MLTLHQPLHHPAWTALFKLHRVHYWTCNTQLDKLNLFSDVECHDAPELCQTQWHVGLWLYRNIEHPIPAFISKSCWIVEATIFMKATQGINHFIICLLKSRFLWGCRVLFFPLKYLDSSCRPQNTAVSVKFWTNSWLTNPPPAKSNSPAFIFSPFYSICWRKGTLCVIGIAHDGIWLIGYNKWYYNSTSGSDKVIWYIRSARKKRKYL